MSITFLTNKNKEELVANIGQLSEEIAEVDAILNGSGSGGPTEAKIEYAIGGISLSDGNNDTSTNRMRSLGYLNIEEHASVICDVGAMVSLRFYDHNNNFVSSMSKWEAGVADLKTLVSEEHPGASTFRIVARWEDNTTITDPQPLATLIHVMSNAGESTSGLIARIENVETNQDDNGIAPNVSSTGNLSIRCAKEHCYSDGSAPVIEYFLLEDYETNRFYISHDMRCKKYAFTFEGNAYNFSFGILQNGDVIAVPDISALSTASKSDSNRINPYVFLASEKWAVQHEVNFQAGTAPCGWLSNCGFRVLPDGSAIFCEYTRQNTATAKVWRVIGDPLYAANWVCTKSFRITSTDNIVNFKHCHTVQYDPYGGVAYLATGDDDVGAMVFYSTDNGATWTQLLSPDSNGVQDENGWYGGSEKYCRLLSYTFTEEYIYWATDTHTEPLHWFFRAKRDENGVLDYSTVEDLVNIPLASKMATYGTAYLPKMNAILLLERADGIVAEGPVRLVDLTDNTLHTIGRLYATDYIVQESGGGFIGFRTRFSEWYPENGLVRFGFSPRESSRETAQNQNKGFGNWGRATTGNGSYNINNLYMQVYKDGETWGMRLGTYYL